MVLTARVWRNSQTAVSRPAPAARPAAALPAGRQARPERSGQVLRPTSVFRPEAASGQGVAARAERQAPASGSCTRTGACAGTGARTDASAGARPDQARARAAHQPTGTREPSGPAGIPAEPPRSSGLTAHAIPDFRPPASPITAPVCPGARGSSPHSVRAGIAAASAAGERSGAAATGGLARWPRATPARGAAAQNAQATRWPAAPAMQTRVRAGGSRPGRPHAAVQAASAPADAVTAGQPGRPPRR